MLFAYNYKTPLKKNSRLNELINGDVIFVSGTSWRATILRIFGDPDYTHVGVVVKGKGDKYSILQAVPVYNDMNNKSGVVLTPIKSFFSDVSEYTIYRKASFDAFKYMNNYLGREFDDKLNRFDSKKIYCTELVDYLLIDNHLESVPKEEDSLWPSTLLNHLITINFKQIE